MTTAALLKRGWDRITPSRPLRLVDLVVSGGLARVGADARLFAGEHTVSRRWCPKLAPKAFTLVFENSQVRVLRLKLGPRQSVPMHEYSLGHLPAGLPAPQSNRDAPRPLLLCRLRRASARGRLAGHFELHGHRNVPTSLL